jgi:PAS domain S-box-containing protein
MKRHISELIDLPQLEKLMESFYLATGINHALLDNDNKVLTAAGWQDICVKFHRKNPESCANCHESDQIIQQYIHDAPFVGYSCLNGLVDYAVPIFVEGDHLANMFTGQFLHEPPDLDFFRDQAAKFHFNEQDYLAALNKIPIIPKERMVPITSFLSGIAQMLGANGVASLKQLENDKKLRDINMELAKKVKDRTLALEILNENLEEKIDQKTRERDNFFNLSNDLLLTAGSDGFFKDVNPALLRVLGWSIKELTETPFFDFIHPDDVQLTKNEYEQQVNDGKKAVNFLNRYRCKDGSYRWLEWIATTEEDGKIYASARDVTERREQEEKIQELNEQKELILNAVSEGLYGIDLNGHTNFVNPAAANMLGWEAEELLGKPHHETIHHHFQNGLPYPREECPVFLAIRDSQVYQVVNEVFWRKDGSSFPVEYTCTPIVKDGLTQVVVVNFRDVTKRKQAENELLEMSSQLEQKVLERTKKLLVRERQLETAKNAAEDANRAKSEFLATMSHEIRTPMNGILGMAELLISSELDPEQNHQAETIFKSGKSLLGIINDILDFSRIEANKLQLVNGPFDLGQVIDSIFDLFWVEVKRKTLDLNWTVHPKKAPLFFWGDGGRLRQILLNLIGNAVKFTNKGTVEVIVNIQDGVNDEKHLCLEVIDTGIGIPPDVCDHLFQPFFQVEATDARRFGGSGLGLAIVKRLVEMMDGKVSVQSVPKKDTIFRVDLSLRQVDAKAIASMKMHTTANHNVEKGFQGNPRILVVNDNDVNADVAVAMLQSLGCKPFWVEGGKKALKQMKKQHYDLVFMDCHMPEMDGYETTERFRKLEKKAKEQRHRLPIVALTAKTMPEEKNRCLGAGMDDLLYKPITKDDIYRMTAKWIGIDGNMIPTHKASIKSSHVTKKMVPDKPEKLSTLDINVLESFKRDIGSGSNKLIQKFIKRLPFRVAEIQAAVDAKDMKQVQDAGHKLKGMGRQYGAMALAHICQTLEEEGKNGNLKQVYQLSTDIEQEVKLIGKVFKKLERGAIGG